MRRATRHETLARLASIAITTSDRDEDVPGRRRRSGFAGADEPLDRADADEHARGREERRLGERGEVLGLAVPVLVRDVRRPPRDAEREEREQRRDEVGAGVDRLGDEAEAVRREPDR